MPEGRKEKISLPHLIAWEVTRSCPMNCLHCRAAARFGPYPGELTTEEGLALLEDIASFSKPIIILTGGEPMMRADIYDLAAHGTKLGLRMVMSPCGILMTEEVAQRMVEAGIKRISISLDGATEESHDRFRGYPGAFEAAMRAIECALKVGLEFQVNTTVTKLNLHELPAILDLTVKLGGAAFHPFLLVPTGRGKELLDQELSPEEYEETLNWIYDQRGRVLIHLKPTCAPHYFRILRQREKAKGLRVRPETHGFEAMTRGCMGGISFAFVSHVGKVQICGFLEEECGDIRREPFSKIWWTSRVFQEMRNVDGYLGRCGVCEYRWVCGGCRARAFAVTGNYLDEEPYCTYQPKRTRPEEVKEPGWYPRLPSHLPEGS